MQHQLSFDQLLHFDPGAPGITIETTLKLDGLTVCCQAKIDTGASYCIFPRRVGEQLGLQIETGFRQVIGMAVGSFVVYGHEVTLSTCGMDFQGMVYFTADEAIQRQVLGRFGWLDRVQLGLIDYEGKLFVSPFGNE